MKFHHYAIEVRDIEESVSFYKKYFGLKEEYRLFMLNEEIVFLASSDFRVELISGGQQNATPNHICFEVANLNEAMGKFADIKKVEGPYQLKNGWRTVFFEGPNQEIIELLQTSSRYTL